MLLAQCILAGLWLAWMSHFFFASRMTKHEAGCQDVANLWALFMKVSQWEVTQFSMNWTIQRMGSLTRLRDMHPGPMEVPSIWVQTILFQSWRLESVDGVGVRFWMIMDVSDPHKSHLGNTDTLWDRHSRHFLFLPLLYNLLLRWSRPPLQPSNWYPEKKYHCLFFLSLQHVYCNIWLY